MVFTMPGTELSRTTDQHCSPLSRQNGGLWVRFQAEELRTWLWSSSPLPLGLAPEASALDPSAKPFKDVQKSWSANNRALCEANEFISFSGRGRV